MRSASPRRPTALPSPSRCTICPAWQPTCGWISSAAISTTLPSNSRPSMTACAACGPNSTCATNSTWGKQLTSIRADISNSLQSEIDSVPGRVRRILRQRADKDIPAGARVDTTEVDEACALIDFVAVCRTYASELAINEVTLRTYSDLQQYVEQFHRSPGAVAARRRHQGACLPADAGRGGDPLLRRPVRPRLCVS